MKRGALIAGLVSGALCAGCVFAYSVQARGEADEARIEAMQRYGGEQVDVLVATKDIYPGETVDASNAEVKTWLSDLLPSGCVTSFDDVKGVQAILSCRRQKSIDNYPSRAKLGIKTILQILASMKEGDGTRSGRSYRDRFIDGILLGEKRKR